MELRNVQMTAITEADVEQAALDWLAGASWSVAHGRDIALGKPSAERGDYISTYDTQRAVEDGATLPLYYEGRLAKMALDQAERPTIAPEFEETTEGKEVERKEGAQCEVGA